MSTTKVVPRPNLNQIASWFSLPFMALSRQGRRRAAKGLIIFGNLVLLIAVGAFLISNNSASQTVRTSLSTSAVSTTNSVSAPLDQISSAQIALQAAQVVHLPEITSVRNSADSEALLLASVPNDSTILSRPQIVSTAQKSRYQITFYKTKPGDSASQIASKFHLSTNSVTASNNLASDYVPVGTVLAIPPANGVVYKVASGDTVSSIVAAYGADRSLFISVNDAENGVYPGERVWIPNVGGLQTTTTAAPAADLSGSDFAFGSSAIYGYNGYDYGTCTWYVASHINVPSNWGNAYTWGPGARASGWTVSSTPRVGAIAWGDSYAGFGYLGHVAIVTAVSADRSQIEYSDMNDPYWNVVADHTWAPASSYTGYIYR